MKLFSILGFNSSAQKKQLVYCSLFQYVPVKFLSGSPISYTQRIEKKHVAGILKGPDHPINRIIFSHTKYLDHTDIIGQLITEDGRFIAMQLHHIQSIFIHMSHHFVIRRIDEYSYLTKAEFSSF